MKIVIRLRIGIFIALLLFTFYLFLGMSWAIWAIIIACSTFGGVVLFAVLAVAFVLIHAKSREKTSTSPRRRPENATAPRVRAARVQGLAQCESNSAADSEQRQENNVADLEQSRCQGRSVAGSEQLEADSCVINDWDGGGVPTTQTADTLLEIQAVRDEILHEVQNQGNKTRVGFFLGCLQQSLLMRCRR